MKQYFSAAGLASKDEDRRSLMHGSAFSRRVSPELCPLSPQHQREQGMPDALRTRSLACKVKSTQASHHRYAETIRHSPRDGFTTYSALSSVIGLCCHRPRRDALGIIGRLTPASRRQDHAASSSARQAHSPGALPAAIASRANVRDDRDTPLLEGARRASLSH
jgi:hypothetical protein